MNVGFHTKRRGATKRLWQEVGGYDGAITFGEDFDLCVRFILAECIPMQVPVTTHLHRNHAASLTACYLDKSVCLVWLAEHRAHFLKHAQALTRHLTKDEVDDIKLLLQISQDTLLNGPPSREMAAVLAAKTKPCVTASGPRSTRSVRA